MHFKIILFSFFVIIYNVSIDVLCSFSCSSWCSFRAMLVAIDTKNLFHYKITAMTVNC